MKEVSGAPAQTLRRSQRGLLRCGPRSVVVSAAAPAVRGTETNGDERFPNRTTSATLAIGTMLLRSDGCEAAMRAACSVGQDPLSSKRAGCRPHAEAAARVLAA